MCLSGGCWDVERTPNMCQTHCLGSHDFSVVSFLNSQPQRISPPTKRVYIWESWLPWCFLLGGGGSGWHLFGHEGRIGWWKLFGEILVCFVYIGKKSNTLWYDIENMDSYVFLHKIRWPPTSSLHRLHSMQQWTGSFYVVATTVRFECVLMHCSHSSPRCDLSQGTQIPMQVSRRWILPPSHWMIHGMWTETNERSVCFCRRSSAAERDADIQLHEPFVSTVYRWWVHMGCRNLEQRTT